MASILLQPDLYVALGTLAGAVAGWLFHRIWRRMLPRSRSREFWRTMPADLRGMMESADPDEMLRHYRALLKATAGFGTRNLMGVMLGIAPTAILFLLFAAWNLPGRLATVVEAHPAATALRFIEPAGALRSENDRLLIEHDALADASLRIAGHSLDLASLARKQSFCATTVSCLLFDIMLFDTQRIDTVGNGPRRSIILRPRLIDWNPLWPYLDDQEFWFFIAIMVGSGLAAWRSRHGRSN